MTDLITRLNEVATYSKTPAVEGGSVLSVDDTLESVAAKRIEELERMNAVLHTVAEDAMELSLSLKAVLCPISTQKGEDHE